MINYIYYTCDLLPTVEQSEEIEGSDYMCTNCYYTSGFTFVYCLKPFLFHLQLFLGIAMSTATFRNLFTKMKPTEKQSCLYIVTTVVKKSETSVLPLWLFQVIVWPENKVKYISNQLKTQHYQYVACSLDIFLIVWKVQSNWLYKLLVHSI